MNGLNNHSLENRTFALLVAAITFAFGWTILPFAGPILWAVVVAVVFQPLFEAIQRRMRGKPSRAALLTLLIITAGIVVPVVLLATAIADEAASLYTRFQSGQIDLGALFAQFQQRLPRWLLEPMNRAGLTDLPAVTHKLTVALQAQFRTLAGRALSIGSDVLGFLLSLVIMLYLAFFLLRDGRALVSKAGAAVPLEPTRRAVLASRFVAVVRATVKGSVVVAIAQGAVGGTIMALLGVPEALLWAVVMGFASLIPAIGTGLVWAPASLYLLATGATWRGIAMAVAGFVLIGSVDNVLRPILVGRQSKMPDALVLLTTLGGLSSFGFNGLIIGPIAAALFLAVWQMVREERGAGEPAGPLDAS